MKRLLYLALPFLLCTRGNAQSNIIKFNTPGLYPEGISYDIRAGKFLVSSSTTGSIGTVTQQGSYTELYSDSTLKSTYGMKVDAAKNLLWVCVSDANYSRYTTPQTFRKLARVIAINLANGSKVHDIDLSAVYKGDHFINDLVFDQQGNAYVTDSYSPVIYKIDNSGKATVFAKSELFNGADIGLNGIVYNPAGYLLADNSSEGTVLKVDLQNPDKITKVKIGQFFPGADGMLMDDHQNLVLVQNKGVDKIYSITSKDNWSTAMVTAATSATDRYQQPSTATLLNGKVYVLNSKMNELADPTKRPSQSFSIQEAVLKPVPGK